MSARERGVSDPHPPAPNAAVAESAGGAVAFVGADGIAWRVVECEAAHVPGARGPRCLIFFSDNVVRRVWDYPATWRALTLAALEGLTHGA